jgi:cobalt-zinc-cadmium efflux system protein
MGHNHNHHKSSDVKGTNLFISILLNILITIAQVIGGFISGSLALLSDALHNFTDVLSLVISYIANILAKRKASPKRTFGYKRAEIIAAFVNSSVLIVVGLILIFEAIERFFNPQVIVSDIVIWLAFLAILVNGISVLLIKKDAEKNMNMKSAYLHLFTDMLSSIAVMFGGILMKYYEVWWVDSVLTLLIAMYLIYVGYALFIKSLKVLMLFTPDELNIEAITKEVNKIAKVKSIHHIHIWQLNEDEVHLEAHLEFHEDVKISEFDLILEEIEELMYHQFGINHITIQPEYQKVESSKDIIVQD